MQMVVQQSCLAFEFILTRHKRRDDRTAGGQLNILPGVGIVIYQSLISKWMLPGVLSWVNNFKV